MISVILSASRRTDVPAFYSEWLLNRLKEGFVLVRNPYRPHQISRIPLNPEALDAIVFWTKNAEPLIDKLEAIEAMGYPYYFQYTITPYGEDVEKYVPDILTSCRVFRKLSERLGSLRTIWRYDPIILNDRYTVKWHSQAFSRICELLRGYTDTCIISFADRYAKTDRNAKNLAIGNDVNQLAEAVAWNFSKIASEYGIAVKTCCEAADFSRFGIGHASCIDKDRLEKICGCALEVKADKNQRKSCGCVESIDVGAYDTCLHGCLYCYATSSFSKAQKNAELHDDHSPLLIGKPTENDKITERNTKSNKIKYNLSLLY